MSTRMLTAAGRAQAWHDLSDRAGHLRCLPLPAAYGFLNKTVSNIREVKARGAQVLCVTQEGNEAAIGPADHVFLCAPDQSTVYALH